MSFRSIGIMGVVGLVCAGVVWGMLAGGCSKNPERPDDCLELPPTSPDIVSDVLLTNPVYSPIDSCIYYVDSGEDSLYFEEFKKSPLNPPRPLVVQPGIYRLRLNSNDPAELVAPWGFDPDITPDGATMYYHPGSWGGPVMKVQLPDGEPELVKDGCFIRACWYSSDTLVVGGCNWQTYFLDISTDSLHLIEGLQFSGSFDAGPDGRIALGGADVYDPHDSTRITITSSGGRHPRWSPDGKEIVYYHDHPDGGGSMISATDLEGNQRTLAIGGGPYDRTIGGVYEPDFTSDGQFVIYIWHSTPLDYDPCRVYENLVSDGQIWIMSAKDGSGKRQFSNWSRIRP